SPSLYLMVPNPLFPLCVRRACQVHSQYRSSPGIRRMAITDLTVNGYRSIRDLHLNLRPVNVLVGPNGCGKSNLYRSMYLLHAAASGELARAIAEEGGMPSVIWAGHPEEQP